MELTITADFAKKLFSHSRKDKTLAGDMARQVLNSVEPQAMARFLLAHGAAEELLAGRLMQNPERTLHDLEGLGDGGPAPRAARPRVAARRRKAKAAPAGKRLRLTAEQAASLKQQIKAFLARQRWSTRKELTRVVDLPTQAIYRRIMQELQDAGEIVSKGEKSKTMYALKGRAAGAKKPAARKPAAAKNAVVSKPAVKKSTGRKRAPAGKKPPEPAPRPAPGAPSSYAD